MFNDRLEFHNNTMVKIQHTKMGTHTLPWPRPQGGGARICPFHHVRAFLLPFSSCGGLNFLLGISTYEGRGIITMRGPFCSPFLRVGCLFCSHVGLLCAGAHAHYIYYNIAMLKCINIQYTNL